MYRDYGQSQQLRPQGCRWLGSHQQHRDELKNAVSTVRTIKAFDVPVVHSTINVASGRGQPTLPELAGLLTQFRAVATRPLCQA
jgi:hypothetical protein